MTSTGEAVIFWILGPLMVIAALGLLFARKAVHAALCVAFVMVNLGVLYIVQQADFLGIVQVFVYTGAVMMFFLFVLMLVGVDSSDSLIETIRGQKGAAFVLLPRPGAGDVLRAGLAHAARAEVPRRRQRGPGNVSGVAELIFGKYVWVFELTSAPAHHRRRRRHGPRAPAADRREARPRRTGRSAGSARTSSSRACPSPGVYARHNAVDTPALLPDGTPTPLSVSRVLQSRDQIGTRRTTYHAAEQAPSRARSRRGRSDEPRPLHLPVRRSSSRSAQRRSWCGATRSSCSWASS